MLSEPAGRSVRVGGISIFPGESRTVNLPLSGRTRAATLEDGIPAHVTVGTRPGPRLTVLATSRGFEAAAASAAADFAAETAAIQIEGSVVVVPVLRPGGRFAAAGRPVKPSAIWRFPGDAGGTRRQREAFAIFSDTCVGSTAIIWLTTPNPGQVGLPFVRGDIDDPRFRRLAQHAGMSAIVRAKTVAGDLAAAARETGNTLVELVAPRCESTPECVAVLLDGIRRVAEVMGSIPPSATRVLSVGRRPATFSRVISVSADSGGMGNIVCRPGQGMKRGEPLGNITPLLSTNPVTILSPYDAVIIEAPQTHDGRRLSLRRGAHLFRLAVGARSMRSRLVRAARESRHVNFPQDGSPPDSSSSLASQSPPSGPGAEAADHHHSPPRMPVASAAFGGEHTMRVGWVERVSLPLLGIELLKAKIDTGARTSALHVSQVRPIGIGAGPHRRPIVEITIPGGGGSGQKALVVRASVRDHVQVKDSSGRTERRPVIETTIRLGTVERRIRVTLTDRGDMLFPMLIGRTALGVGIVVDPSRRYLLPALRLKTTRPTTARAKTKRQKPGSSVAAAASEATPK